MHYPGHLVYLEEAAVQLAVDDRGMVDQARRLGPLANLSSLVGQAYEARRNPLHREVDLQVARRQAAVLELALTAARAILLKASADLRDPNTGPPPLMTEPNPLEPRRTRR